MNSKINVLLIAKKHFHTLVEGNNEKISVKDVLLFIVFPLVVGLLAAWGNPIASHDFLSLTVNFGAITTALLMSVVVLVYDQESKLYDRAKLEPEKESIIEGKVELLKELYHNICFAIVSSLFLVTFSFLSMPFEKGADGFFGFISAALVFVVASLLTNIVLTILMVIKRFHILLTK